MATYSSHRLIYVMGKVESDRFSSQWRYFKFVFTDMLIVYSPPRLILILSKLLNLIGCKGDMKGNFSINLKNM